MGDHDVEHVAMPTVPGTVLVVVHAEEGLGFEEGPLDGPAELGDRDQGLEGDGGGGVGEDILGGLSLVLGLRAEEEERLWGARWILGALGHSPDRDEGHPDPLHPKGVRWANHTREDGRTGERVDRDGRLGQDGFGGTFSAALGLREDPGGLCREHPGVGADGGHVGKLLGERVEKGPVRSEEGVDADPARLEKPDIGGLLQEFGGDLRLGGEGQGLGNAGLLPARVERGSEPLPGQIETGVDQTVGPVSDIAQEDAGLAIVDLAPGTAIWRATPTDSWPFLGNSEESIVNMASSGS